MAAHGNENVIRALEHMLVEARGGKFNYFIGLMVANGEVPFGKAGGSVLMEEYAAQAVDGMMLQVRADIENKMLPPGPIAPADRVVYNMCLSPLSFDFACWLIDAEMTRRIEGAPAPLKVAFWHGRDGKSGGLEVEHRRQMFQHVVRPLLALIGAVEDESAVDGRWKRFFSYRNTVERYKAGHQVPRFKAPNHLRQEMAGRYNHPVTLTLREYSEFQGRNSNTEAWIRFAGWLRDRGENVVVVRDTLRAHDPIPGFTTCPAASLELSHRLALYETAKMNLFVSNGPASLGHFGDFPWLMFTPICDDDDEYEPNTPKFWREQIGVEMGGQFPWCRPDQRIVWMPDNYENLVRAWLDICEIDDYQPLNGVLPV